MLYSYGALWSSFLESAKAWRRSLHDWSPQPAHAKPDEVPTHHLVSWVTRRLQTPSCFKVGQRHGLHHLPIRPVTQEQNQDGARSQIKFPHCIQPGGQTSRATISPPMGPIWKKHPPMSHIYEWLKSGTQTCQRRQDTFDEYISGMEVKMDQILAVDWFYRWGDLACHVKAHWWGADAVAILEQPSTHMQDVVLLNCNIFNVLCYAVLRYDALV